MLRLLLPNGGSRREIKQQDTERVHTRCVMTEAEVIQSQRDLKEILIRATANNKYPFNMFYSCLTRDAFFSPSFKRVQHLLFSQTRKHSWETITANLHFKVFS